MESSLRVHPNYRKACRILEELPLWSLDKETALKVIDTLSSILGLPFRYAPRPFRSELIEESKEARCDVANDGRTPPLVERIKEDREPRFNAVSGGHPIPPGASDHAGLGVNVVQVVDAKIEQAKELLGVEGIVK